MRRVDVDLEHFGKDELRVTQLRANRRDDVAHFEFARRHLGQHRRKQREVFAAEHDQLGFAGAQESFKAAGDRDTGESAAEDDDDGNGHGSRLKRAAWNTSRRPRATNPLRSRSPSANRRRVAKGSAARVQSARPRSRSF